MNSKTVRSRFGTRFLLSAVLLAVLAAGTALGEAKSVILLIGDGMGPMTVKAASIKLRGADGRLAMQGLPVKGSLCTTSYGGGVTDSAAAATALATGYKTKNGVLGMTHDGSLVRSILEACRDAGKSTGLVATSTITHATPAGFASHVTGRGMEFDIAEQMLAAKVNVLLGGGKDMFMERNGEAFVGVDFVDAEGKKLSSSSDRIRWTTDQSVEHGLLVPPGAVKASVWIWKGSTGVDAFFDDFAMEPKKSKDEPANLIVNGDFEKGDAAGWNVWSGCAVGRDGASSALRVDDGGGCDQAVAVVPGTEYTLKYRARIADPYAGMPERLTTWMKAERSGYTCIDSKDALRGVRGKYVLGLFKPGSMEGKPDEPTLEDMAKKAVDLLEDNRGGFFLMVEGSQIDWGAHGNDLDYLYREMASFDATVKAMVTYAKRKRDVLVVVCADHETGGVSVEGKNQKNLKVTFGTNDHTATMVPLFAYGPGSKPFAGPHDNTEVPGLIAKALGLSF